MGSMKDVKLGSGRPRRPRVRGYVSRHRVGHGRYGHHETQMAKLILVYLMVMVIIVVAHTPYVFKYNIF